jgi:flagellar hook-length control protein FliK
MAGDSVPLAVLGGRADSGGERPARIAGPGGLPPGTATGTSSPSPAAASSGSAGGGSAGAKSSTSQSAKPSAEGSSATGSGAANSASSRSKPSGKGRSAGSSHPSGASSSGRRTAHSSGASNTGSAQEPAAAAQAPAAADTSDFSAALAQSLAATPADGAATTGTSAAQSQPAGAGASSEPPTKPSATDPVSSALALFEQALAGALAGVPSTPVVATAPAASTSSASSADTSAIDTAGQNSAAALNALLTQSLTADPKAGASNPVPAGGSSTPAAPTATATTVSTAAAALTAAAQLTMGSHVGSQQLTPDPSSMALRSPVGTDAWTEELGAKLTWMANQGIESASLQLSPEHLGPLQVSISVRDGQASVWFGAAQPDTRTVLQQSLPQLRQLFASQGLTLADAGVSREPPRGQSRQQPARTAAEVAAVATANLDSPGSPTSTEGGLHLIDIYA